MNDIGNWLRSVGLEQFSQLFEDNLIDLTVLPDLTDDHLKELGLPLGARMKILKAAQSLADQTGLAEAPATSITPAPQAERRQLTVMFVDLVGSTELSSKLDPEDMADVIRNFQNGVAGEIGRFDGYVAKFLGDGVLAYFGWPRSHEDEAERAVRAGLAILAAVQSLRGSDSPLSCRIGIATGLVVVGELIGSGSAQEQTVVGDTPNLAARLQALAKPNQMLLAGTTRSLLGGAFALELLGEQSIKGLNEPVEVFAVVGERTAGSRFEVRSGREFLPMVGRDQELALLIERWEQAKGGEGQCVLLIGEAGIGKSRITRALLDTVANENHFRIRYQCSPYHTDSAFWPVAQQLRRAAGISDEMSIEGSLDRLEELLSQGGETASAFLIAALLGLDGASRYGPLDLTPQAQRERTLLAIVEQLVGLALSKPVLVILEDAHWIDPTTLELIEQALDAVTDVRALLVVTSRPDHQPELAGHPHVTRLTLNRLGRVGVEAIVERLGGKALPEKTVDEIIARTDGVPLFVEELTKAIVETGETAVPSSLHDSLMARLDRIPEVKEVAQTAACIGREFRFSTLSAVYERSDEELFSALDQLTAAELVFRRGAQTDSRYTFKHALVQDAAYESLLRSKCQSIHARLLKILSDEAASAPEALAMHAERAGLIERAIELWHKAGSQSLATPAYKEAIASLGNAIRLCHVIGDDGAWGKRELEIQLDLGQARIANIGYSASIPTYERALDLAEEVGDSTLFDQSLFGLWAGRYIAGMPSMDLAERFDVLATHNGDRGMQCIATRMLALEQFHRGNYADSQILVERALEQYDDNEHRGLGFRFAQDPRSAATNYRAWNSWHLGFAEQAREHAEASRDWALIVEHPNTIGISLCYGVGLTNIWRRDVERVEKSSRELLRLAKEKSLGLWQAWGQIQLGWTMAQRDDRQAISEMEAGLGEAKRIGARRIEPFYLGLIAETHLKFRNYQRAKAIITEAFQSLEETGDRPFAADLHRINGLIQLHDPDHSSDGASRSLLHAIEIARKQRSPALELRAAHDLANYWAQQGNRQSAYDLLAPVYKKFTEGFDTDDLREARELLEALG